VKNACQEKEQLQKIMALEKKLAEIGKNRHYNP
jgi:hypothetical protein